MAEVEVCSGCGGAIRRKDAHHCEAEGVYLCWTCVRTTNHRDCLNSEAPTLLLSPETALSKPYVPHSHYYCHIQDNNGRAILYCRHCAHILHINFRPYK